MDAWRGEECFRSLLRFEELKAATLVQRKYRKEPPGRPTIYSWHKNFVQT
jgi:chromosome segregation and condensation protein ScpB